jgi:hypothetical protein
MKGLLDSDSYSNVYGALLMFFGRKTAVFEYQRSVWKVRKALQQYLVHI